MTRGTMVSSDIGPAERLAFTARCQAPRRLLDGVAYRPRAAASCAESCLRSGATRCRSCLLLLVGRPRLMWCGGRASVFCVPPRNPLRAQCGKRWWSRSSALSVARTCDPLLVPSRQAGVDWQANFAMKLAKTVGEPPRVVAQRLPASSATPMGCFLPPRCRVLGSLPTSRFGPRRSRAGATFALLRRSTRDSAGACARLRDARGAVPRRQATLPIVSPEFMAAARRRVVALQSGDPHTLALWRDLVEVSLAQFPSTRSTGNSTSHSPTSTSSAKLRTTRCCLRRSRTCSTAASRPKVMVR